MFLTVEIEGIDGVRRGWAEGSRLLGQATARAVAVACEEGVERVRRTHRYVDRTGALTRSAYGRLEYATGNGAVGEMVWPVPYASFVDAGTEPHTIRPKVEHGFVGPTRKSQGRRAIDDIGTHRIALRWYDASGEPHFAREVHHPGTPAYGFAGDAALKAEAVIVREVEAGVPRMQAAIEAA